MKKVNFKKTKIFATTLTIGVVLSACGAFGTKEKGRKAKETDTSLAGEWRGTCNKLDWLGLTSNRQVLTFSAVGDFDRVTTVYSDNACNLSGATVTERGTVATLGKSNFVADAKDINFTVSTATIAPANDDSAKSLNTVSYCGRTDWQKDVTVDVLGKECLGKNHAKGEVNFDIYRLDGDKKLLTFGKGSIWLDKSDASTRPTELDETKVFEKQ